MSCFVVNYCELKACQHWRLGNKCIKNGMKIEQYIDNTSNMHDSNVCEVRKQVNIYRSEKILEE